MQQLQATWGEQVVVRKYDCGESLVGWDVEPHDIHDEGDMSFLPPNQDLKYVTKKIYDGGEALAEFVEWTTMNLKRVGFWRTTK